ncbi:Na+/H+ antiporter NhaA [Romboutsia sedimentorum]|uniref:Na+/H+ antiporter NhaA n=1 Tax=Romboutsia sedimentorum TaxID=1368474 RepID=UPI0024DEADCD|nr:Na+/H+ antiporter NhaA [Romboutsia sedimentorum]MDK2586750.1 Na+/H+ antiporter NhaA [Romboutsia sedimentorum]
MKFLRTYRKSIKLELLTSILLVISTISALFMYNSYLKDTYVYIFEKIYIKEGFSLHMFINDFLMSIFFLVAALEIKHEILHGNLSSLKKASFPFIASLGGVIIPALIFILINKNTPFLSGFCIPISTDIAFAIGVFLIFAKKMNPSLKIFLLSLAVIDDLVSILAIGIVYSLDVNIIYLSIAFLITFILIVANKIFKINSTTYYLLAGICLWYFIYLSGVHCTISGILLAITIPTSKSNGMSTLERLQKMLVPFNSLVIIPLFAFANTGISIIYNVDTVGANTLIYGIILGLCVGKPLGIMLFSFIACKLKITEKPKNISWAAVFLVSLIAGIGFTMSIFVSEIAFSDNITFIIIAKMSILLSSCLSIISSVIVITLFDIGLRLKRHNKTSIINKYYIS